MMETKMPEINESRVEFRSKIDEIDEQHQLNLNVEIEKKYFGTKDK